MSLLVKREKLKLNQNINYYVLSLLYITFFFSFFGLPRDEFPSDHHHRTEISRRFSRSFSYLFAFFVFLYFSLFLSQ